MSEDGTAAEPEDTEALRARLEAAERRLEAAEAAHAEQLIRAELKAEAVRAGMVDLDGLRLLDLSGVTLGEGGVVQGADLLMQQMRRSKPWLFTQPSTSSSAVPPPAQPPRQRLATEMGEEEWRAARAEMIRRR